MSVHRPSVLMAASVAAAVIMAGCGGGAKELASTSPEQPSTSLPTQQTTIIEGAGPAAMALATSRALFDRAPVVALASEDDLAGQQRASELSDEVGGPLLLVPAGSGGTTAGPTDPATGTSSGEDPENAAARAALEEELRRLGPAAVVPFGDAATGWAESTTAAPVTPAAGGEPDLPPVAPGEPLDSLLVLAPEGDDSFAATATARASGARILAVDGTDPRADPAVIEALAGEQVAQVAALGAEFGPPERLRHRLEVAATGTELPGGGQVVFPGRRMVALYGHPGSDALGVLGEQPLEETVERTQQVAEEYRSLVDEPVVPVFEIITTVASSQPGPDGDYSVMKPPEELRPWVDAAADAGIYVVLDLQPGRTDFLTQAEQYAELLAEPHVGLALDPEWRLAPDEVHLEQIGSVSAAEVNEVAEWLAELTREHRLPQKLLVLHQFRLSMISDREELDTGFDELATLIHADGHGTKSQKLETWRALRADPPDVWWGWKNFYDEDRPTLSPAETVDIEPSPRFVSYQ